MVRSKVFLGLLLTVGSALPMLANPETTSLQSIETNVNGATQTDYTGYNTGGFNTTTGLGTLTYTFTSGLGGSFFFDVFFDHQLNLPFFNEFGTVLGAPAAGQSYEIGDSFASSIYDDVGITGGALPNTNTLPGTTDNFGGACDLTKDATCNGDFSAALGFSFVLGAGESELITLNVSHTDPGSGLRLQDTHPTDGSTPNALNLFISGSAKTCAVTDVCGAPTVPEPASVVLFGSGLAIIIVVFRRRLLVNL